MLKFSRFLLFISLFIICQNCFSILGHPYARSKANELPEKQVYCEEESIQISFPREESFSNTFQTLYILDFILAIIYSFSVHWPIVSRAYIYSVMYMLPPAIYKDTVSPPLPLTENIYSDKGIQEWAGEFSKNCQGEDKNYFYFSIVNRNFRNNFDYDLYKHDNKYYQEKKKKPTEIFLSKILSGETGKDILLTDKIQKFIHSEFSTTKEIFCTLQVNDSYCLYSYFYKGGEERFRKKLLELNEEK